jgi:ketosteroid isomerase-like protein
LFLFPSPANNNNDDLIDEESEEFQRKVRVAKARAEIDRILKAPDAPFDLEGELKKCEGDGISPPPPPPPLAHREQLLDDQVGDLEAELYAAVDQQDYPLAQQKKEEIARMHVDDCGAVLQVNSAFYRAFSEKDYNAMEKLWLKDASTLCIHPAHAPLVGANAILTSWKNMFEPSSSSMMMMKMNGSFQRNWMSPSMIRLTVKGATAILTCDEEVFVRRFVRGKKRQTELVTKLFATNIFRKVDGRWYMVHHHASWHADSEAAKMALKGGGGGGGGQPAKSKGDDRKSLLFLQRRNRGVDNKNDEPKISPDGILGKFGPILGGPSPAPQEGVPVKRVIMGNLSDLLNGGLNELLSGSSDDQQDEEEGTAIIQFHQVDGDEDDEDDDAEDDDDDDDSDENDGTEAVSIIKRWGKSIDDESSMRSESSSRSTSGPNDALRQNCISALRKLANQVRGHQHYQSNRPLSCFLHSWIAVTHMVTIALVVRAPYLPSRNAFYLRILLHAPPRENSAWWKLHTSFFAERERIKMRPKRSLPINVGYLRIHCPNIRRLHHND